MPTATVHIADVGGFPGRARCFAITPPFKGHDYVTVCVVPAIGAVTEPEAMVFPAVESGACAEMALKKRPGSFVLHDEADTDEAFSNACAWSLLMLGQPGYEVTV